MTEEDLLELAAKAAGYRVWVRDGEAVPDNASKRRAFRMAYEL